MAYSLAIQSAQTVNPSDLAIQNPTSLVEESLVESEAPSSTRSMDEYYQLRQELLVLTLLLMVIAFGPIWWFYSLRIALNYLVGACTGVVYLRLLARNVERLGVNSQQVGKSQLAVFIGVIIFALKWKQLDVVPVFLGFLTLKAAIIVYTLKTVTKPQSVI